MTVISLPFFFPLCFLVHFGSSQAPYTKAKIISLDLLLHMKQNGIYLVTRAEH
jgi:hypothetical protein